MFRRRRILVAAGVLAALALLALAWRPLSGLLSPPPKHKLTLAVSTAYIGSGLVHIAADRGYFAAEGIEATIQSHTNGRSALEAVTGGRADPATAGDTPLMFAVLRGTPVAVVATLATVVRARRGGAW